VTRLVLAISLLGLIACSHSVPTRYTTHHLRVGGVTRTWFEVLPARPKPHAPLLIMLAGFDSYPTGLIPATGLTTEVDADGFVVALPRQLGGAWNAGDCCGRTIIRPDDVGFMRALIDQLVSAGAVDPKRVYVAGFSNGGMLAYRLGCQLTSMVAGVAVFEGALVARCPPHRSIDTLVVHQTADPLVPYLGSGRAEDEYGDALPFPSVATSLAVWLHSEQCGDASKISAAPTPANPVATAVWACPDGTHALLEVLEGGGHYWPRKPPGILDGMQLLTQFFKLTSA
jgi:polyhydroxybutyrate depolymerase